MQMLPPQIEETVFEPDLFRIFLLAEHRHGQVGRRAEHLDLIDVDLDLPCRQIGIFGASRPPAHLAVNAHTTFRAQRLRQLESLAVGIGNNWCESVVIRQIYEQHPPMVANAVAPSRKADDLADIALAKRAAGM